MKIELEFKLKPTKEWYLKRARKDNKTIVGYSVLFTDTGLTSHFTMALSLFYPEDEIIPKEVAVKVQILESENPGLVVVE